MKHDEIMNPPKIRVHRMPKKSGMQEIHRLYGLWILGVCVDMRTPPDSYRICGPRYFEFYSISHLFDGAGKLWLEATDSEEEVNPGDYIIIPPNTVNRYGGWKGKSYIEDAIQFCGPAADMLLRSGVIQAGVYHGETIRALLPIIELAQDPAVDSQIQANMELQQLLTHRYLQKRQARQEAPRLEHLLEEIRHHPERWWTVREMAELCHLSDDQLRRIFLEQTGVLPKLYVDRLKLRHAAQLLTSTTRGIAEIAESLGYQDPYHFSRRFKEVIGCSPLHYRKTVSSQQQFPR